MQCSLYSLAVGSINYKDLKSMGVKVLFDLLQHKFSILFYLCAHFFYVFRYCLIYVCNCILAQLLKEAGWLHESMQLL